MATFNTINELIEVLDSNPAWLEELRARILTRDLLELPARLAQYAENTDRRLDALEEGQAEFRATFAQYAENTDRRLAALEEGQAEFRATFAQYAENTDRRLAALEEGQAEFRATFAQYAENTDRRLAALEEAQTEMREVLTRLTTAIERLDDVVRRQNTDIGTLRGAFALYAVNSSLNMAIWNMTGGDLDAALTERELFGLFRSSGVTDLPPNEVTSFVNADIVARVIQPDSGVVSYVAIEVSYTVQGNDIRRAVRNAEYLTQFTGLPAQPAVAGLHLSDYAREDMESADVLWHQISERDLRAR